VDEVRSEEATREVVCPHCRQTFVADLITGPQDQPRGFKCPHCRLFVALDRATPAA
jgi:DNA-directed RNA polymerase subunit RPC12/RpoP